MKIKAKNNLSVLEEINFKELNELTKNLELDYKRLVEFLENLGIRNKSFLRKALIGTVDTLTKSE